MKSGVKLPGYVLRDTRSGKSLQVWIASHQQWLGVEAQWLSHPRLPASLSEQQAQAHRWRGSRLERDTPMCEAVLSRLSQGWSPEQAAGRLASESGHPVISHESIYRFIYAQLARKKDYSWCHYLPRAKSKRGWRGRKGGRPHRQCHGRGHGPLASPVATDGRL